MFLQPRLPAYPNPSAVPSCSSFPGFSSWLLTFLSPEQTTRGQHCCFFPSTTQPWPSQFSPFFPHRLTSLDTIFLSSLFLPSCTHAPFCLPSLSAALTDLPLPCPSPTAPHSPFLSLSHSDWIENFHSRKIHRYFLAIQQDLISNIQCFSDMAVLKERKKC